MRNPELVIAEQAFSSAANFERLSQMISFPKSVEGMTILDLGGGASDATLRLRKRGAIAYTIDPKYADRSVLRDSIINEYFTDPYWTDKTLPNFKDRNEYVKQQKATLHRFMSSSKNKAPYYIPATAAQLPFTDESFDFVYSSMAISYFLIPYRDIFLQSIHEALRVLKSSGQLQLYPWTLNHQALPADQNKTRDILYSLLRERNIPYTIEPTSPITSPRLRITKV